MPPDTSGIPLAHRPCDAYVVDEVLRRRAYAKLEIATGDVVLDLGAHVGSFVRYALDHGAARVVAVEPNPETLPWLNRNFGRDPRVYVYPAAVSGEDVPGTATFKLTANPMGSGTSRFLRGARTVVVPTVTLTHLLATHEPTKLKFDVEFAEYDTLLPLAQAVTDTPSLTRLMGELHTRSEEALELAREFWRQYVSRGWTPSRHLLDFPEKPSGWNVHLCLSR